MMQSPLCFYTNLEYHEVHTIKKKLNKNKKEKTIIKPNAS